MTKADSTADCRAHSALYTDISHSPVSTAPRLGHALSAMALLLMVIASSALSSCHSSRQAAHGNVGMEISDASTTQLYDALAASYSSWTDLYVPVTLALESPKQMAISGRATMIYGQEINISLRVLGIEAGVVYINNETMYVVDKYHKCYYQMDISKLLKAYDLTLGDFQDVLLGRAVVPGQGIIKPQDEDKFTFLSADEQWILSPVTQIKGADWHYTATKSDPPVLSALSMRIKDMGALQCLFSEPTLTPAGIVDALTTMLMPYKDTDIQVSITWRLDDAKWDSGREVKFSVPGSSYRRLDLEGLLKSTQNL